jgi:hypothetical protein
MVKNVIIFKIKSDCDSFYALISGFFRYNIGMKLVWGKMYTTEKQKPSTI